MDEEAFGSWAATVCDRHPASEGTLEESIGFGVSHEEEYQSSIGCIFCFEGYVYRGRARNRSRTLIGLRLNHLYGHHTLYRDKET